MSTAIGMNLDSLATGFAGQLIRPSDAVYDEARAIWNGMIDKKPAVIARCSDAADIVRAVNFARDNGLTLAVRSGGHHIAGNALCDNGLVVDLSRMKAVRVDPQRRRAIVEAGATLADFDAATQAHGLATPVGINSTTGIAGLTLGGGFGWLSRKYGMTVDNLESARVVTAAGEQVRASASDNPDLFWALRGGGGNFGVVSEFEYRLHPVGPEVLSGLIVYPFSQAGSILKQYRKFIDAAPDELTVWTVLRLAPPLPFLAAKDHGKPIIALAVFYADDPKRGESLIPPLRTFGTPLGEHIGPQPYVNWQKAFDPLLTPGARNYWKSHNFTSISDGLIEAVLQYIPKLPSPQCEIFFGAIGGATTRAATDATAYPHRDAKYVMNVHGRWDEASADNHCIQWAREFFKASAPFASAGAYINFLTADETDRVKSAFGPNHARLAQIKQKYDPHNLFCTNQNIKPA